MFTNHVSRKVLRSFDATAMREGTPRQLSASELTDVIEIDLGDGITLFTAGGGALTAQLEAGTVRDGHPTLKLGPRHNGQHRGALGLAIKSIKVIDTDVDRWLGISVAADMVTEALATRAAALVDDREVPGRNALGLYRCDRDRPYAEQNPEVHDESRILLMLHGFMSNAAGTFDGFWQPPGCEALEVMLRHYRDHVYCFDHATVGRSPISNALAIAKALPSGARVHLLAHSRGGLVGEVLSRAQHGQHAFGRQELDRFESARSSLDDVADLHELTQLMTDKQMRVERFVRVGSPIRGTWLASDRLDRWLSILYNVARFAIPTGPQAIADCVFDILAAVIKKRLDRKHFPGIEAMRPDGPLVALLNDSPKEIQQRLTVIGGDCVGSGIFQRLKLLITDGFFGEAHDLVVPTASMFGGASREGGIRYFYHQTPRVDHFHYFRHPESLQRIQTGLTGTDDEWSSLQKLAALGDQLDLAPNRAVRPDAPLNVVLPGIMGSALSHKHADRLWVDFGDLALGKFTKLRLKQPGYDSAYPVPGTPEIYPSAPLDFWPVNFYGSLMQALARRGEVVLPYGYDWRKPIWVAADALARTLEKEWPEDSPRPLRIIAHSMGGLVARVMFARHPKIRHRFAGSDRNRLLMLGTPNAGSLAVIKTLLGDNPTIEKLDCIAPQEQTELLTIASTFPGFLELSPPAEPSWLDPSRLENLYDLRKVPVEKRPSCDMRAYELARAGQVELQSALDHLPKKQCVYVAGFVDPEAPDATVEALDERTGAYKRGPGDGTVTYASGHIDGVPTWYVNAPHGDLAAFKPAFPAYFELLDRGDTSLLPKDTKGLRDRRRGVLLNTLRREEWPYRPNRGDVYRALFGASPLSVNDLEAKTVDPIVLRIVNGGLRFARHPIIVGHYQGDQMSGSEADLNRLFGGQMRTALDLGVHPADIQSFQVFKRKQEAPDKRSPFAIVVGLGQSGDLSVGDLRKTVRRGLLGWFGTSTSAVPAEHRRGVFSVLLLGSSVSGMSVSECTRAILQGVQDAQGILVERLRSADGSDMLRTISEIEIVELYEDKALELAHELPRLLRDEELSESFRLEGGLETRKDAVRRIRGEARTAAARRLDIRARGPRLHFSLPGIQAAVPTMNRVIDIAEIQTYAREVDDRLSSDPVLGRVLFNQLLPLELKHFALEQYDLLLTLNESASSIPWELTDSGTKLPLSVQSGMIRQLRSGRYKARERVGSDTALVVGAPLVAGLPPLEGARVEAETVANVLKAAGFRVTHLDRPSALEVRDELSKQPYRIIHFAGHGVVDYVSPCDPSVARTGMVIGSLEVAAIERRKDAVLTPSAAAALAGVALSRDVLAADAPPHHWLLLTPDDIEECVAQVPELVFINCCHLGRQAGVARNAPKMASNFANSFMNIGCRAVVAAGWAVDDLAAQTFADRFYDALVRHGERYIEAVRQARKATYRQYGRVTPTWGAYQCYGDPGYLAVRLPHATQPPQFGTSRELEYWLRERSTEAMGVDDARVSVIREKIIAALSKAPHAWLAEDSVFAEALDAYDSVAAFPEAAELIQDRIAAKGTMSPKAWSFHSRMQLRLAMHPVRGADRKKLKRGAEKAMDQLKRAARADNSSSCWWSYATYCRRWFLLQDDTGGKLQALSQLARASTKAWQMTIRGIVHSKGLKYDKAGREIAIDYTTDTQAQKALAAVIVELGRKACEPGGSEDASNRSGNSIKARLSNLHEKLVAQCEAKLGNRAEPSEFWDDVDHADLQLLLLASPVRLAEGGRKPADYLTAAHQISDLYQGALPISATAGQRESITSIVRFWLEVAHFFEQHSPPRSPLKHHWASFRRALITANVPGSEQA